MNAEKSTSLGKDDNSPVLPDTHGVALLIREGARLTSKWDEPNIQGTISIRQDIKA